jgi:hypothetical protein
MKLSAFKAFLQQAPGVNFVKPDGVFVPRHFHITEVGLSTKHFIDCGGTVRTESAICFQLWVAQDFDHRLSPQKLLGIVRKAEPLFEGQDLEIEVEYQSDTIGRYGIELRGEVFELTAKQTNCLAQDKCGIPASALPVLETVKEKACCTPGSGCC